MGYEGKLPGPVPKPPDKSERSRSPGRPFARPAPASPLLPEGDDGAEARIDRAARYGHNLASFAVTPDRPSPPEALPESADVPARAFRRLPEPLAPRPQPAGQGGIIQRVLTPAGGDLYDWVDRDYKHAGRVAPSGRYQRTGSVYRRLGGGDPQEYEMSGDVLVAREAPSSSAIGRAVFHSGASALRSPDVRTASSIYSAHPDQAHVVEGPSDLLGSVVADSAPRAAGSRVTRETFFGDSPSSVTETQATRSRGGRSDLLPALGTYPVIEGQIRALCERHHLTESAFADLVIQVHQGGNLTGVNGEVRSLAENVARLVYGTESARSVSNIAVAPMAVTAVATGLPTFTSSGSPTGPPMTFSSLFTGASSRGGGQYPASMQGAVPAARREHKDVAGVSSHYAGPVGTGPQRDELASRTSGMVRRLVEPSTLSSTGRLQASLESQTATVYANTSAQEPSAWEQQQEVRARNALKKLMAVTNGNPTADQLRNLAEQYPDTAVGRGILQQVWTRRT